jgi:hypothetical protein
MPYEYCAPVIPPGAKSPDLIIVDGLHRASTLNKKGTDISVPLRPENIRPNPSGRGLFKLTRRRNELAQPVNQIIAQVLVLQGKINIGRQIIHPVAHIEALPAHFYGQ